MRTWLGRFWSWFQSMSPNSAHTPEVQWQCGLRRTRAARSVASAWGVGFVEALYRFGKSLGTRLADRSVDLIAKASKAGGDVSEVLRAAAKDTFEVVNLQHLHVE